MHIQIVNFHLAGTGDEEFRAVKTHPNFVELSSCAFVVLDGPSRITRAFGPALATA
jgi:hypothetical protein